MADLVEKPRREDAPSNLAIIGRYILTPDIFPALAATKSDRTGEIQLTNAIRELLRSRPIYACEIDGVRHDTGNKLGFLKALVYFAMQRPELAEPFREYLETLDLKVGAGSGRRATLRLFRGAPGGRLWSEDAVSLFPPLSLFALSLFAPSPFAASLVPAFWAESVLPVLLLPLSADDEDAPSDLLPSDVFPAGVVEESAFPFCA